MSGRPGRMGHGLDDAWWFCGDYAGTPAAREDPTPPSAEVEALVRRARHDTLDALRVRHGLLGVMKEAVDEMTDRILTALRTPERHTEVGRAEADRPTCTGHKGGTP